MTTTTDWRAPNVHNQILKAAEDGKYGVLAAVVYNVEQIYGLVAAAEQTRSPLILQFFPWAVTYAKGLLVHTAAAARRQTNVPISIHLDHAQSAKVITLAAETLPFDSIMVDMSHYEKEENLAKTAELVAYCQTKGIATEAEPGRIEGGEDGVQDTAGLQACMTTTEEVEQFYATGVDTLAPAFGNVHGGYGPQGPQLDFERLNAIRNQIKGRLRIAIHGTNGFTEDVMKECIAKGATKINVNKLVLKDYYSYIHHEQARTIPHTMLIQKSTEKVTELAKHWMVICGSAGKA